MKFGKQTTRLESNGSQLSMRTKEITNCYTRKNLLDSTFLFRLFAFAIAIFLSIESANAQNQSGYVVQPGRIDINISPRKTYVGELRVHNFDPNNPIKLDFKVIELTQSPSGDWLPFDTDPNSTFDHIEGLDLSKVSSCSSWIKLDKYSVEIQPDDDAIVGVRLDAPVRAGNGFYGATIMASTTARASETTLTPMVVRTGIPVVANVVLRNLSPQVEIKDIDMEFIPTEGPFPGRVNLKMDIKNTGSVFPRLKPIIRVRGFIGGHWKLITTHEFDEIGIIPGITLNLVSDLERSLPSGKYRLDAALYVNQRLMGARTRFGKEIDFEGDPMLTKTAFDVPLDLDPPEIIIEARPGQIRTQTLRVHAAVEEKIQVQPIIVVPKSFEGKVDGNVRIDKALTCVDWLRVEPDKLTLEDFRTRNFSIKADFPEDALKYPNYYAALGLKVVYPDGQVAGTEWINVCIKNPNAIPQPKVECISIQLEELNAAASEYIVRAGFQNGGNTDIRPIRVRAAAVKADGFGRTSAMMNTDTMNMFMPYETRYYKGVLDFGAVEPDEYNLEVLMNYPSDREVKRQVRIRVVDNKGKKVPEIIDNNVSELIPVQWY